MKYDKVTKVLHRLLAAGVVLQLLLSLIMSPPEHGLPGNLLFTLHEVVGLALIAVLVAHWLWMLPKYRATPHYLFPWTSPAGREALAADVKVVREALSNQRLPPLSDVPTPVVGAVQGLGLLVASLMALTGLFIFLGLSGGELSAFGWLMKQLHELLAWVLWLFVLAHVAAAIMHQWFGEPVITDMFRPKNRS